MRVGLVGGTGLLGRALASRLASKHQVLIGSREKQRGESVAEAIRISSEGEVSGGTNMEVAEACEVAILAVPDLDLAFLEALRTKLGGKVVISPVVPMRVENGFMIHSRAEGSAAEGIASVLKESRIVAALHNIPAATILKKDRKVDFDVLVACDAKPDYEEASRLIASIEGLRPLYVGSLAMARTIEEITPLLLNAAKLNGLKRLSVKLVS
ncbi:MAG: NADPH-dependent F420 reductase [Thaumarchaeota archaeon]|nr:NADPH-dependent F420 reductase [Nitrososphaerota archaeon]